MPIDRLRRLPLSAKPSVKRSLKRPTPSIGRGNHNPRVHENNGFLPPQKPMDLIVKLIEGGVMAAQDCDGERFANRMNTVASCAQHGGDLTAIEIAGAFFSVGQLAALPVQLRGQRLHTLTRPAKR